MKNIKHALMVKKLILACMARSNLSSGREVQNYQDRKAATRRAFSVIPKYFMQKLLKNNKRNRGIEQ
jgi:hypothetical protein